MPMGVEPVSLESDALPLHIQLFPDPKAQSELIGLICLAFVICHCRQYICLWTQERLHFSTDLHETCIDV